ncbi:MAG: hypothetical protein V7606_2232, partial [Burkholderiales bacterium]
IKDSNKGSPIVAEAGPEETEETEER